MAKVVITITTAAAPDHNNTRVYAEGEEYEVDTQYMPRWLADALILDGIAKRAGKVAEVQEVIEKVVDTTKQKAVPHPPGPAEVKKAPPAPEKK